MKDEIVLVTGASSGIGEASARRFAAAGARVVVAARRLDRLKALAEELGPRVLPLELDVMDQEAVARALSSLPPEFSALTVLVNNAGAAHGMSKAYEAPLEDWEQMVDLNIKGLLYVTHAVLPGFVERDRGLIINLGSVAGRWPYPGNHVYGATKAFVSQLSINLRTDLIGKRVRVTSIEPGMVKTDFSKVRFAGDEARAAAVYQGMEALTPEDIAESIFWVASLPPHVNINNIEVMPTMQAVAGFTFHRNGQ